MPQVVIPAAHELWRAGLLPFNRLLEHQRLDQVNDVFHKTFEEGSRSEPVLCMWNGGPCRT